MNLPEMPEGAKLAISCSSDKLEVEWGVASGELNRKLKVAGLAILLAGILVIYPIAWWHDSPLINSLVNVWLMSLLLVPFSLRELFNQAKATGHGKLKLSPETFWYEPGGGKEVIEMSRMEVLKVHQGLLLKCRGSQKNWKERPGWRLLFGRVIPAVVIVQISGGAEQIWMQETLRRWHTGTLFANS